MLKLCFLLFLDVVLALVFVPLREQGVSISAIRFNFNMYTGPVYLNALWDIVSIILIVALFRDYKLVTSKTRGGKREEKTKEDGECMYSSESPI